MYLRKYSQRQKDLKKALSWWEDQDENPDISYVDFSRRKLVFDFGSFRRVSDISARWESTLFYYLLHWFNHSRINLGKNSNLSTTSDPMPLPSNLLRRWKKASTKLNMAILMMKISSHERWVYLGGFWLKFFLWKIVFRACSDPELEVSLSPSCGLKSSISTGRIYQSDGEIEQEKFQHGIPSRTCSMMSLWCLTIFYTSRIKIYFYDILH